MKSTTWLLGLCRRAPGWAETLHRSVYGLRARAQRKDRNHAIAVCCSHSHRRSHCRRSRLPGHQFQLLFQDVLRDGALRRSGSARIYRAKQLPAWAEKLRAMRKRGELSADRSMGAYSNYHCRRRDHGLRRKQRSTIRLRWQRLPSQSNGFSRCRPIPYSKFLPSGHWLQAAAIRNAWLHQPACFLPPGGRCAGAGMVYALLHGPKRNPRGAEKLACIKLGRWTPTSVPPKLDAAPSAATARILCY